MGEWHGIDIWKEQQGSRRLAGACHVGWLINILKCQIWVQPKINSPTTCIGYSKWDISLSKWDMPIIACNATMAAPLRCVPLPWDCDTPYSQITQTAAASQRSWIQYARRYQNSSVWESQKPSSVCQCHVITMSLSDEVLYFIEEIDSLDTSARPLSCTAFAASPPLAHGTARSQRRDRQNVTIWAQLSH